MDMDIPAVQGIASKLKQSGTAVVDSAARVRTEGLRFDAGFAGREYRSYGAQIVEGFEQIDKTLSAWGHCVEDCGFALDRNAAAYQATDQGNAVNLNAVEGGF